MSKVLRAFFTRVLAGLVVLFPIAFVAVVIGKLLEVLGGVNAALAEAIPKDSVGTVSVITLVSIATVLLVLFVLGSLIAPRHQGQSTALERRFLNYIPGYSLIRGLVLGAFGHAGEGAPSAGLLRRFEGVEELVVILDRMPDGRSVVYLPHAPTPTSGSLLIVANQRLEVLDASLLDTLSVYADWGQGAGRVIASEK